MSWRLENCPQTFFSSNTLSSCPFLAFVLKSTAFINTLIISLIWSSAPSCDHPVCILNLLQFLHPSHLCQVNLSKMTFIFIKKFGTELPISYRIQPTCLSKLT
ncbi:unnamed protein product [Rangifer tarandus platyrhynchus]|uniref:Uncharacterized protein n=1 Tax=Rangifer tarandus platyrhynchus TaxID=3082113 RepID=A0AC59Y694_RANTA